MYKILLLVRDGISPPLYTFHTIRSDENVVSDYEAEEDAELEETINELGKTIARKQIIPVNIVSFVNETILGDEV